MNIDNIYKEKYLKYKKKYMAIKKTGGAFVVTEPYSERTFPTDLNKRNKIVSAWRERFKKVNSNKPTTDGTHLLTDGTYLLYDGVNRFHIHLLNNCMIAVNAGFGHVYYYSDELSELKRDYDYGKVVDEYYQILLEYYQKNRYTQ